MIFKPITDIMVGLDFGAETIPVGRLALNNHRIYFAYDNSFIRRNIEISPINCRITSGMLTFDKRVFGGLPGVFNDSLPDGWGKLLLDRQLTGDGISPELLSPLDRLVRVGNTGMGALVYQPAVTQNVSNNRVAINTLAAQSQQILKGQSDTVFPELLYLSGASAGARPKAMIGLHNNKRDIIHGIQHLPPNYQYWIVKFPANTDSNDTGAIEYVYAQMARNAGLDIPDVHLFSAQTGAGYFAVKRFDRQDNQRLHMHSAAGLLHADIRTPTLDYEGLITLTMLLTKDHQETEKMYRLAVFNVLAHNRDDHGKNFSFLMNAGGEWKMAPAYDLTYAAGPRGEHCTMIKGKGNNLTTEDLIMLGQSAKIHKRAINNIIDQTKVALSKWPVLAKEYGVSQKRIDEIQMKINKNTKLKSKSNRRSHEYSL